MTTQISEYNTVLSCVLFEHIIHYRLHEKKKMKMNWRLPYDKKAHNGKKGDNCYFVLNLF